ncbi:hypothetical protein B5F08_10370, partial [Anaeromassilibacillus sp. An172]|uniref:hypothetical protein n=1 Tax=Anaeromassilibacillus sp. An172 TaxID=1965570 RepID=UPI000B57318C
ALCFFCFSLSFLSPASILPLLSKKAQRKLSFFDRLKGADFCSFIFCKTPSYILMFVNAKKRIFKNILKIFIDFWKSDVIIYISLYIASKNRKRVV